ncbi:hypothetical protein BG011_007033 [Mortierella polycephala]|uniref:Uncharacterized protein n=1 Tax=Mortierella polycephala TaxID=41804 RepID=A0A9P6PTQ4_9FUNG|nr:hypothetical protein BG011_007033 [Mortierella polycephala]
MATVQENVVNDMVASQLVSRIRHKDGTMLPIISVFSVCYEFLINYTYERIRRHHEAFRANKWDPNGLKPESRVCMILNRFSRDLIVMYASSPSCDFILHIDPEKIVGKPFLVFICSDDLASFVEQIDIAKSLDIITHT